MFQSLQLKLINLCNKVSQKLTIYLGSLFQIYLTLLMKDLMVVHYSVQKKKTIRCYNINIMLAKNLISGNVSSFLNYLFRNWCPNSVL